MDGGGDLDRAATVHPTRPDQLVTLAHGLAYRYQQQGLCQGIHPIHRLDRDTSGVVLIAKSPGIQHQLSQQIQARLGFICCIEGIR